MVPNVLLLVCGQAEGVVPGDLSCGLVDVEKTLGLGIELAYPSEGDILLVERVCEWER